MKVKVNSRDLSGSGLDYAVSICVGLRNPDGVVYCSYHGNIHKFKPCENWSQGGVIIEREGISWHCGNKSNWHAYMYGSFENVSGETPLIAAMRCYVVSKLGESVLIPVEFAK